MGTTLIRYVVAVIVGATLASGSLYLTGWRSHARILVITSKAQADILVPYCVASSRADPWRYQNYERMKRLPSESQVQIVESAGWATPLDQNQPNQVLAEACLRKLDIR